jgi:hypothetical protein
VVARTKRKSASDQIRVPGGLEVLMSQRERSLTAITHWPRVPGFTFRSQSLHGPQMSSTVVRTGPLLFCTAS